MGTTALNYAGNYAGPANAEALKRVSWPAVFGGTLVSIATELLFTAWGLFIGFKLTPGGGLTTWAEAWWFVTAFVSLFVGGWVAAKLATNTYASGRLHGAVTWGLTTLSTFVIAAWLSWTAISASIGAIQTAVRATDQTAANPAAAPAAQAKADQLQRNAAATVNNVQNAITPQGAAIAAGDASTFFLVIFGGILCGCVASLIGGTVGGHGDISIWPATGQRQTTTSVTGQKSATASAS